MSKHVSDLVHSLSLKLIFDFLCDVVAWSNIPNNSCRPEDEIMLPNTGASACNDIPSATSCTIANLMHLQIRSMSVQGTSLAIIVKRYCLYVPIAVNCAIVADEGHHTHPIHMICNALRANNSLPDPPCSLGFLHTYMSRMIVICIQGKYLVLQKCFSPNLQVLQQTQKVKSLGWARLRDSHAGWRSAATCCNADTTLSVCLLKCT